VVTAEPPADVTAGTGFGLSIAAEDTFGNIDPSYGGAVTVALKDNPDTATLGGTLTVAPTQGVAVFTGLTLERAATGVTLGASSGTLNPTSTTSLTVTAAAATQLVVTSEPPADVTAGTGFGLAVAAEDAFGNVDPTFSGTVTIGLENATGGAVGGTLSVAAAHGVATFAGLTLSRAGNGEMLEASSGALDPASTTPLTVTAAAATQLVVTGEPPANVIAGSGFGLTVAAEDPFGNVDPAFSGTVDLTLVSNPGGATFGGTLSAPARAGTATLAGLTLDKAASGYTLKAASGGLTAATTTPLAVAPASATQLVVTTEPPATVTAGSGFGLVAAAEDPLGNVDPTDNADVTLALAHNPGGASLGGTATVMLRNGVATFGGLTLDRAAAGYVLAASSGGLSTGLSSGLDVHAAPATQLVVTAQPPDSVGANQAFGLTVTAEDPFGNVDTNYGGDVSVALASNPGGATPGGTLTTPASGGVATFHGLTLDKGASGVTLQVTSGSLSPAATAAVAVIPPPVIVLDVSLAVQAQHESRGKHKADAAIVVHFDGALNPASAANLAAYTLTTVAQGKKPRSRQVPLAQAIYNAAAHTVTLITRKQLVPRTPLQLRISGASVTDTLGRPLEGNRDGQPGGDSVTIFR
jgi:hypothetical protein